MTDAGSLPGPRVNGRPAQAAAGVILLLGLIVAGCSSAATTSPSISATPVASAAAAATPAPTPPPVAAAPTAPPVISCAFSGDGPPQQPTKPLPKTLPASLPIDLVPAGAAIYAITFPEDRGGDAYYTVGPLGGTCRGFGGNYVEMQVLDAAGAVVVDISSPGSLGPNQLTSCAYIAAARKAAEAFWGASLPPSECVRSPGDQVTPIATGVPYSYLAAVLSSTPGPATGMSGTTASLYTFWTDAGDDTGASSSATCAITGSLAPACHAALAFFVGDMCQIGSVACGLSRDIGARIAAVIGVPATPAP